MAPGYWHLTTAGVDDAPRDAVTDFLNAHEWERASDLLDSFDDEFGTGFLLSSLLFLAKKAACPPRPVRIMLTMLQDNVWWIGYRGYETENCCALAHEIFGYSYMNNSTETFKEFAKFLGISCYNKKDMRWALGGIIKLSTTLLLSSPDKKLLANIKSEILQVHSVQDLEHSIKLRQVWTKTELLLQSTFHKDLDDPSADHPWLVTHALVEFDSPCLLVWLALRMYPEQARTRDHLGRLPLHYAAQRAPTNFMALDYDTGELSATKEYPFTLLLRAFPEAATLADSSGKRPLNYALDLLVDTNLTTTSKDCIVEHLVDPLIAAVPETLAKRERSTRLYPYQQAAVKDAPLDVVFKLLVGNPSAIHCRDRSWVEKENESLLAENDALKGKISEQSTDVVRLAEEVARLEKELAMEPNSCKREAPITLKREKDEEPDDDTPLSKRSYGA